MTFQHPQNHPCSFTADVLLVRQLLARDCSLCEYERDRCLSHLLIPRGVHFSTDLFPQIIVPRGHAAPFSDPQLGVVPPFFNMGLFASMDMLFPSAAGDLDLFTDMEISGLVLHWVIEAPNHWYTRSSHSTTCLQGGISLFLQDMRPQGFSKLPSSCNHGSQEVMKTWATWNMNMRQHANDFTMRSALSAVSPQAEICPMGSNVVEPLMLVFPMSIPTQKSAELRERGLMNAGIFNLPEHPLPPPFLLTPTAPSHPTTGSVSVPSVDPDRGSSLLDKGTYTGVPMPVQG